MTEHRITRHTAVSGYVASCACGWRITRRTRELRDEDAWAHGLADTLTGRRIGNDRP